MAVHNHPQQGFIPKFPPETFEGLRQKYREMVRSSLPDQAKYPDFCKAHWAIMNDQMDILRSLLSFDQIKAVMTQRREESAREIQGKYPKINYTPDPVEEDEVNEEIDAYVNDNNPKMGLTPLHVAVMIGHVVAVRLLVESGRCQLNEVDHCGATAAHHAAVLGEREIVLVLGKGGADLSRVDEYGGTVQDLLDLIHEPINQAAQRFFSQVPSGELIEETGLEFYERTQAVLLDSNLVLSPSLWFENWKNSEYAVKPEGYRNTLRESYFRFRNQPTPRVFVKHDPVIGYYLCAGEFIPRFTVIGEYLGKIDTDEWEKKSHAHQEKVREKAHEIQDKEERCFVFAHHPPTDYNLGAIDAYAFRGLMGLVSDSFPNIITQPVMSARGVYQRTLFIAATDIQKGEVLAFDYGNEHQVKRMPFKELRQDAMEAFFRQYSEEQLVEMIKRFRTYPQDLNERLEILSLQCRLEYLLHSPTAMLSLYLKGVVTVTTLLQLFEASKSKPQNDLELMASYFQRESMQQEFLGALEIFDEACQEIENIPHIQEAKTALEGMFGTASTLDIYRYLIEPPPFNH